MSVELDLVSDEGTAPKQPRLNRRRFIKRALQAGATATAIASGLIAKDDATPTPPETRLAIKSAVVAVFKFHKSGIDSYFDVYDVTDIEDNEHVFQNVHKWTQSTAAAVRRLNPQFLAIDGLSYTTLSDQKPQIGEHYWYALPANPFELKTTQPLFIVSADSPDDELLKIDRNGPQKDKSETEIESRKITLLGIKNYYEKQLKSPADEDFNSTIIAPDKQGEYSDRALKEMVISMYGVGLGSFAYLWLKNHFGKTVSRREFTIFGTLGIAGILNSARVEADIHADILGLGINLEYTSGQNPLMLPISAIPLVDLEYMNNAYKMLEMRNALIAIKLTEAQNTLASEDPTLTGQKVALLGFMHGFAANTLTKPEVQRRSIDRALEGIFKSIAEQNPPDELKDQIVKDVASYLGTTAIHRVDEAPEKLSVTAVNEKIVPVSIFISPTISLWTQEAAKRLAFIFARGTP